MNVSAPEFARRPLRAALLFLCGASWFLATPSRAENVPAAQVFRCEGTATVRTAGSARAIPLTRGMVLASGDRVELRRGAEVGLYYRQGGRQLLRAGTRTLTGTVGELAPTLAPYRGQSVSFGATRGQETTVLSTYRPAPDPILLAAPPRIHVDWNGSPEDSGLAQRLVARILVRDTIVAEAAIDHLAVHSRLELDAPLLPRGDEYRLEIAVFTANGETASCTHSIPFYIALASRAGRDSREGFLTDFLFRQDAVDVLGEHDPAKMLFDQELATPDDVAHPTLTVTITPARPIGPS